MDYLAIVEAEADDEAKQQGFQAVEMQSRVALKSREFHEVEQIDLAEGWRQIVVGEWKGVGLLDVLEGHQDTWGRRIIIAEPGRDRRKLRQNYPGAMIFTPAEFQDAVEHWPGNAAAIQAKKTFFGDISK